MFLRILLVMTNQLWFKNNSAIHTHTYLPKGSANEKILRVTTALGDLNDDGQGSPGIRKTVMPTAQTGAAEGVKFLIKSALIV